jgi:hypothetical protein
MISPESKAWQRLWTDGRGLQHCLAMPPKPALNVREEIARAAPNPSDVSDWEHSDHVAPELQVALVRRAVDHCDAVRERCQTCRRTPLVGERVYFDEAGTVYCELCRALEPEPRLGCRVVHGPEFGHTMRLTDHRAA